VQMCCSRQSPVTCRCEYMTHHKPFTVTLRPWLSSCTVSDTYRRDVTVEGEIAGPGLRKGAAALTHQPAAACCVARRGAAGAAEPCCRGGGALAQRGRGFLCAASIVRLACRSMSVNNRLSGLPAAVQMAIAPAASLSCGGLARPKPMPPTSIAKVARLCLGVGGAAACAALPEQPVEDGAPRQAAASARHQVPAAWHQSCKTLVSKRMCDI
jgi:hypothetical protein